VVVAMGRFAILLLLAAPLAAQEAGGGAGADPARFFAADTFAYVELDASALEECLPEWQVAKIVTDPALQAFLRPALERLGADPEKAAESLHERFSPSLFLEGRVAFGVRGTSAVARAKGREWRFRVAPDAPLDAAAVFRWLGMMVAIDGQSAASFELDIDFLAVGRPGPLGWKFVEEALARTEGEKTKKPVKVLGLDGTHLHVIAPAGGGFFYEFNLYAVERDGTWFLASVKDTLERALGDGPRASLAESASLARARARFTSGRPLLLAHVDPRPLLGAYKALVPPVAGEMGEISGINAVRGLGFGISLVDGGLRESFGILLDGERHGVWRLLDAMPGGLRSLEVAPPGALASFGLKLDLTVLRDRIRAYCADVLPGCEDDIEREIEREMPRGLDLVADVLPALGDEAAVVVYPAGVNEILPRFVVGIDGRDEAALGRLAAKIQALTPAAYATFAPAELEGGIKAVQVLAASGYDAHFAVGKRHLFLASSPTLLREVLTQWGAEGRPSLLRDDPMLSQVLRAANGGDTANLAALGYVNLRACSAEVLKTLPLWGSALPADWFDVKGISGVNRIPGHLTGMAVALRHDKEGISLDCFSPVGVLVPAAAASLLASAPEVRVVIIEPPPREGTGRPSLGLVKTSEGGGVKVLGLAPQGAAARSGLRQSDRIVALDGVGIATKADLDREMANKRPGETVEVTIRRGDTDIVVAVELDEEVAGS